MHFVACPGGFYMLAKKLPRATDPFRWPSAGSNVKGNCITRMNADFRDSRGFLAGWYDQVIRNLGFRDP